MHADINSLNHDLATPLHVAIQYGMFDESPFSVPVLGPHLISPVNINLINKDGWGLLHLAAKFGDDLLIRLLLERGADANLSNKYGLTPLHIGIVYKEDLAIMYLMKKGSIKWDHVTDHNWSFLHYAIRFDAFTMVKF